MWNALFPGAPLIPAPPGLLSLQYPTDVEENEGPAHTRKAPAAGMCWHSHQTQAELTGVGTNGQWLSPEAAQECHQGPGCTHYIFRSYIFGCYMSESAPSLCSGQIIGMRWDFAVPLSFPSLLKPLKPHVLAGIYQCLGWDCVASSLLLSFSSSLLRFAKSSRHS